MGKSIWKGWGNKLYLFIERVAESHFKGVCYRIGMIPDIFANSLSQDKEPEGKAYSLRISSVATYGMKV